MKFAKLHTIAIAIIIAITTQPELNQAAREVSDRVSPYFVVGAVLIIMGVLAAILAALAKRRRNDDDYYDDDRNNNNNNRGNE